MHDASKITLKYSRKFRRRVQNVYDALNYSSIFPRRIVNVQDASPISATIFQCYFGRVMQVFDASKWHYDPFARIIKNPLKSTIFWTRHLNSATRRLNSATRQILHWNIVAYFGEASSQLGDASAQLRDASKMQLWPQWLTIPPPAPSGPKFSNSENCCGSENAMPPKIFWDMEDHRGHFRSKNVFFSKKHILEKNHNKSPYFLNF